MIGHEQPLRICKVAALAVLIGAGCTRSEPASPPGNSKEQSAIVPGTGELLPPDLALAELSADQLRRAPETVVVEGTSLKLRTYLWRDFMPMSPPGGQPMRLQLTLYIVDAAPMPEADDREPPAPGVAAPGKPPFPHGINVKDACVILDDETWCTKVSDAGPTGDETVCIVSAADGPKWGPGANVDVVVRVVDTKGKAFLVRAPDQPIHRTD